MVHGKVVQESPQRRGRNPTIQTLCDSLGTVPKKSRDRSLGTVLEQCSLGTVQSWDSLGTVQSWDSLGPEQSWYGLGTVQSWDGTVLGQCSLGTVQSWDGAVLGHWSWDSGLGTVVLGQWSWDTGLGTVPFCQIGTVQPSGDTKKKTNKGLINEEVLRRRVRIF